MNSSAHHVYTTLTFGNLKEFANSRKYYNKHSFYFILLYLSHYKLKAKISKSSMNLISNINNNTMERVEFWYFLRTYI